MAVQPFHVPKFRALDSNGDPLSGGLLYTYAAGTTTPQATYTTRAGDVANANPVVLDANGEASVWVTPNVTYKFVLKNSAGVTQWTEDNVPSLPDLSLVPLEIGDGTVAAPAVSFVNDPDCGLYRVGSESVGMAITGVQRQRWTSSGTVVTGTAEVTGATTLTGAVSMGGSASIGGNVALTGADPASATGFTDTITPKNIVKAWGRISTNGSGGVSVVDGFNVASVSVDASRVTVTFTSVMANGNYATVATSHGGASGDFVSSSNSTSSSVELFVFRLGTGMNVNPSTNALIFSFMVLGAQ